MNTLYPDVPTMLRASGVDAGERPFPVVDAYSGARFSAVHRGDERLIIKRINLADEWPLAAEHDPDYREAQFAVAGIALPDGVETATVAACIDGDGRALLMRDVSEGMLTGSDVVSESDMRRVIDRVAALHAEFWEAPPPDARVDWCAHDWRLTMLSPRIARMLVEQGRDFGLLRGWETFARLRPALWRSVESLIAEPTPLVDLMAGLPRTLLHGDLKLGNMSLTAARLALIDWSMVAIGPVGMEIGWFLAVNSSRLPWTLDDTLRRYASALRSALSEERWMRIDWDAQLHVAAVAGVMFYGWGKALDYETSGSLELDWWCERAERAFEALAL